MVSLPPAFRMRSTWAGLVCIRLARAAFVMPRRSISCVSCQATTRVIASVFTDLRIPSSLRNVSIVVPQWEFFGHPSSPSSA